jgi:hypothetical protein
MKNYVAVGSKEQFPNLEIVILSFRFQRANKFISTSTRRSKQIHRAVIQYEEQI